ncbi:hypothetical protein P153DRAFT_384643 [Dothidotthia symphoricarpi CBS 119687]|uniref:F-box domain-containing protein n=1 Tax=Dothidotthia symphoricarpi CBS 119687 TaxID=1392245 RepID=A0A6A6AFM9_9PLEO|nr:uncharacterized protein P153DRAFT_384643 [Dothidotthia symphoricarpi CBS 119687]KAF2130366.1 hypothetical protein P153DRAFT_384643 [Dothidotthia symphoricarpi CBS 119687]
MVTRLDQVEKVYQLIVLAVSQESNSMLSNIPFLPPEIHRIISQYVDRADLPSYRLADKALAQIGAEELFRTITIQYSSTSITRLNCLRSSSNLRKYVETLIWDTNTWRIPNVRDFKEWERYFSNKVEDTYIWRRVEPRYVQHLTRIRRNRQEWEVYADRLEDERRARGHLHNKLESLLVGFDNLGRIDVVNGVIIPSHRGVEKIYDELFRYPGDSDVYRKGEGLFSNGRHVDASSRPAVRAFSAVVALSNLRLKELKINTLCWQAFRSQICPTAALKRHLTTLYIRLTSRAEYNYDSFHSYHEIVQARHDHSTGSFSDFLTDLPNLESLRLDFKDTTNLTDESVHYHPTIFESTFRSEYTWPSLRKLSLRNFETTPEALLSLLQRQKSTLKTLTLQKTIIGSEEDDARPSMEWVELIREIRSMLQLDDESWANALGVQVGVDCIFTSFDAYEMLAAAATTLPVEGGEVC